MTKTSTVLKIVKWLQEVCPSGDLFSDSREIKKASKDAVFIAYQGDSDHADGRQYIDNAIQEGAKAILYEANNFKWQSSWNVPHCAVDGLKELAGAIADQYYASPSQSLFVTAVTGTNGKTSCTQWLGIALSLLGEKTAVIGTLGVTIFEKGKASQTEFTGYTTPDPIQLQRRLAQLKNNGVQAIAIEASSIGIDEQRLNALVIDIVLFTNFTRDHLDYHGSMEAYERTKRKLFNWPSLKAAVFNLDDPKGKKWSQELNQKLTILGYTLSTRPSTIPALSASHIQTKMGGTSFQITSSNQQAVVHLPLIGNFNVSNVLGVLGVLLLHKVEWNKAIKVLSALTPPPGRMQMLGGDQVPLVVIDYAHTPDALEKGIETLKVVAKERNGQLWCVFGCGGDRDKGKRKEMGRIAEKADQVIVTSDNPRSEEPRSIMNEIIAGMSKVPIQIEDRSLAILEAVKQARVNDIIFLAGKGHETYQEIKGVKYPFEDINHARLALKSLQDKVNA